MERERLQAQEDARRQEDRQRRRQAEEAEERRIRDQQTQREQLERQRREMEAERLLRQTDPRYIILKTWVLRDINVTGVRLKPSERSSLRELKNSWINRKRYTFNEDGTYTFEIEGEVVETGDFSFNEQLTLIFLDKTSSSSRETFTINEISPRRLQLSTSEGDATVAYVFSPAN